MQFLVDIESRNNRLLSSLVLLGRFNRLSYTVNINNVTSLHFYQKEMYTKSKLEKLEEVESDENV